MGMSYLTSSNTQLFKNIAYVRSFGHILFNLIFNVNSNLAESSANCSEGEMDARGEHKHDQRWTQGTQKKLSLFGSEETHLLGAENTSRQLRPWSHYYLRLGLKHS